MALICILLFLKHILDAGESSTSSMPSPLLLNLFALNGCRKTIGKVDVKNMFVKV